VPSTGVDEPVASGGVPSLEVESGVVEALPSEVDDASVEVGAVVSDDPSSPGAVASVEDDAWLAFGVVSSDGVAPVEEGGWVDSFEEALSSPLGVGAGEGGAPRQPSPHPAASTNRTQTMQ
jgi:hypothetical protein